MQTLKNSKNSLWVARDMDGSLFVYFIEPKRFKTTFGQYEETAARLPYHYYPEVTWDNSPKELTTIGQEPLDDYEEDW